MTKNDYEQYKQECWVEISNIVHLYGNTAKRLFDLAFDKAYALGKQSKNQEPQYRKAKVKATGEIIEVKESRDYNIGIIYFLDVNDDDADPYDYHDLIFMT